MRSRALARSQHPSVGRLGEYWSPPASRYRGRAPVSRGWPRLAGVMVAGATVGGIAGWATADAVQITVSGIEEGAVLSAAEAENLSITVEVGGLGAGGVVVTVNGSPIEPEEVDDQLVVRPAALLRDGPNELQVRVDGKLAFGDRSVVRRFAARLTTAQLATATRVVRPTDGDPIVVSGLVDDAVAVSVDGRQVDIGGGAFSASAPPSATAVTVTAVHANGNETTRTIEVVDTVTPVNRPETRAVHITAQGWADPELRGAVLQLVADGRINAVQLDIKDESGEIGFMSDVGLANEAGSVRDHYDIDTALTELHALGVRVIGRIVCFLDPVVAGWAWEQGRDDMVVQAAGGTAPLDNDYGSAAFTNFASAEIQQFLIDLAVESADAGFDEILYDYVRRPEGPLASMTIPDLQRPAAVEIARFVRDTQVALEPFDVDLGVSVFGIAATRPDQIAQDIGLLGPHVDYISPMVYPSHWGDGEYGVGDPNREPGAIVERSLADFQRVAAGSGAAIVPWLQAFSAGGVTYGPAEIQAQIDAARAVGSSGYLLWNSGSRYDAVAGLPSP